MTDKQIIINGVSVSGCEHYDEVCLGNHHYKWCKDNDNCYYKQLKRKEQECEALQMSENEAGEIIAELQAYKDVNEDFKTAWKELKAENEELKAKIKYMEEYIQTVENARNEVEQQLDQLNAENEILQKISEVGNDNK